MWNMPAQEFRMNSRASTINGRRSAPAARINGRETANNGEQWRAMPLTYSGIKNSDRLLIRRWPAEATASDRLCFRSNFHPISKMGVRNPFPQVRAYVGPLWEPIPAPLEMVFGDAKQWRTISSPLRIYSCAPAGPAVQLHLAAPANSRGRRINGGRRTRINGRELLCGVGRRN